MDTKLVHIFLEVGAGVGKTQGAKAVYESVTRYYNTQPGESPDNLHIVNLAPAGMATWKIKSNTIHSAL